MPYHFHINVSISRLIPLPIVPLNELSFHFKHVSFEAELDFNMNKTFQHQVLIKKEETITYILKIKRNGSLIGFAEIKLPLIKTSDNNEALITKDFEIQMVDSKKKMFLGPSQPSSLILIGIAATMFTNAISSSVKNIEKTNSYRERSTNSFSPKVEKKISLINSKIFSSSMESEFSLVKTPPNKYSVKNNIFFENKSFATNQNILQQMNKKSQTSKTKEFKCNDSGLINNSSLIAQECSYINHNNNIILSNAIPMKIDPKIGESCSLFMSQYSIGDNSTMNMSIAENDNVKVMHAKTNHMVTDFMNYISIVQQSYNETSNINRRLRQELIYSNEDYRHIIKVENKLEEKKQERQITSLIKVIPAKKLSAVAQCAIVAKQQEISLLHQLFGSLIQTDKMEKFKELKMITNNMTDDEKSIILLVTIKNVIANYGRISAIVPSQYYTKILRILSLYDIKEKPYKIGKINMMTIFKNINNNIRKITEQDDEDDLEEKKEIMIRKTLIDNKNLSKVPFERINGECYKYGTMKIDVMCDNEKVMINYGNEVISVKKFIEQYEQIEDSKINKALRPQSSKRTFPSNTKAVKSC